MSRLTAEKLAEEISNFINGAANSEMDELAALMASDHPTLQQKTMVLACKFIETMASKEYTDARNKYSKEVANKIIVGYRKVEVENVIAEEGSISESYREFLGKVLPSKNLPLI